MMLMGRMERSGAWWAIEVPILGVHTQGRTKKEAHDMIADAIEVLVDKPGFKVEVHPGKNGDFLVGANNEAVLTAFLLRQVRQQSGISLAEAAERLGLKSKNAYARYEQGRSMPTLVKLSELVKMISGQELVLSTSR
jgi:hypothetical protein